MNKRIIQNHFKTDSFSFIQIWNKINSRMPSFFSTPFFILISTLLVVALLFPYTETVPSFVLPKIGEASQETIIAPFTFDIVRTPDELEREKKKQEIRYYWFLILTATLNRRCWLVLRKYRTV